MSKFIFFMLCVAVPILQAQDIPFLRPDRVISLPWAPPWENQKTKLGFIPEGGEGGAINGPIALTFNEHNQLMAYDYLNNRIVILNEAFKIQEINEYNLPTFYGYGNLYQNKNRSFFYLVPPYLFYLTEEGSQVLKDDLETGAWMNIFHIGDALFDVGSGIVYHQNGDIQEHGLETFQSQEKYEYYLKDLERIDSSTVLFLVQSLESRSILSDGTRILSKNFQDHRTVYGMLRNYLRPPNRAVHLDQKSIDQLLPQLEPRGLFLGYDSTGNSYWMMENRARYDFGWSYVSLNNRGQVIDIFRIEEGYQGAVIIHPSGDWYSYIESSEGIFLDVFPRKK